MESIIRGNASIDTQRIVFSSTPYVAASGATLVPFSIDGHPLYFQTPIVTCPVGFRIFEKSNHHKLMINPSDDMLRFVKEIDDCVIDNIMIYCDKWFNKNLGSREIIEALFYPSLKFNKNYPPSMNVRLRFSNDTGLPLFTIFDSARNEIRFNSTDGPEKLVQLLKPKCQLRLIIGNASVWGVSGRYGYGWDCMQLQICATSNLLCNVKECLFFDMDDDAMVEEKHEDEQRDQQRGDSYYVDSV